jgi:FkbM family methyltransferase
MRRIINFLINLYLLPLKISRRLALYVKGRILTYEEHYAIALDVVRRRFPGDRGIIADIGSYDGDSARYFSKRLPHNKIFGFEPNPVPFEKGKQNIKSFSNIELFNVGLSIKEGAMDLHVTSNIVSSSLFGIKDFSEVSLDKIIKVQVTTLDSFFEKENNILLLKLDIQGAELDALKGGRGTLLKTKLVLTEVLVTEMYDGGCLYFQLDAFLREHNFHLYSVISNYNSEGTKYFDILYINSRYG